MIVEQEKPLSFWSRHSRRETGKTGYFSIMFSRRLEHNTKILGTRREAGEDCTTNVAVDLQMAQGAEGK